MTKLEMAQRRYAELMERARKAQYGGKIKAQTLLQQATTALLKAEINTIRRQKSKVA